MNHSTPLTAAQVCRICDPDSLPLKTTADIAPLDGFVGQPRVMAALDFGTSVPDHGFNLFATGAPGSGKTTLIRQFLQARAAAEATPPDLCYVHNFVNPQQPLALELPAGTAVRLRQDMQSLIRDLHVALIQAFESQEYTQHRQQLVQQIQQRQAELFQALDRQVTTHGFVTVKTPVGLAMLPADRKGQPLSEEQTSKLSENEQKQLIQTHQQLATILEETMRQVRQLEREGKTQMESLNNQTARFASGHLFDELRQRYQQTPALDSFFNAVQEDVLASMADFLPDQDERPALFAIPKGDPFAHYRVNVLVDNSQLSGAPIIIENNPSYQNLIGRIEHQTMAGGIIATDFSMLKAGALHRANGGYLVLPVRECLLNPFAWDALKRVLREKVIHIEEMGAQYSLINTVSLDPQPVTFNAKVVLIGTPQLYAVLQAYDEDFATLFKVKADFTGEMPRTPETEKAYASFIRGVLDDATGEAIPFDKTAVARIVEYGSRLADDQQRLSTRFSEIANLVRETIFAARRQQHPAATAADVTAALDARHFRNNLIEEHLQRAITEGTLLIDTAGTAVGRINGLAVLDVGDMLFGQPSRISAAVSPGNEGVTNIEREVHLSGPIHGKAVLIIRGYLNYKYGAHHPLALSASIVFEQSYGMVDGDSASLAELIVLLSAISGIPVRQDIAITGSMNQHGDAQPIGGVNYKVEGFFDVCQARGLSGTQGVVIPQTNVRNLMLREDVVTAVAGGQFHIWPVKSIDEALEIMLDTPAGTPGEDHQYPDGTIHRAVSDKLAGFAAVLDKHESQVK